MSSPVIRIHASDNVVIAAGQHVHTHNLAAFEGIVSEVGCVATGNHTGALTSVNWSATAAHAGRLCARHLNFHAVLMVGLGCETNQIQGVQLDNNPSAGNKAGGLTTILKEITAPSLKLSTNTALWLKQQHDIDIDCGSIVEGLDSVDQVGERIFCLMLDTASGRQTKREGHGYGQNEFVAWQLRAVM